MSWMQLFAVATESLGVKTILLALHTESNSVKLLF